MKCLRYPDSRTKKTYQNRIYRSSTVRVHEGGQLLVDVALAASVNGQGLDLAPQPFVNLVVPVFDKTAWRHNYGLLDQRLAVGTLSGTMNMDTERNQKPEMSKTGITEWHSKSEMAAILSKTI